MKKTIVFFVSIFFLLNTNSSQSLSIQYEMNLNLGEATKNLPADIVKKITNMVIDFKYYYTNNQSEYSYVQQRAKDPNIPKMQSTGEVATTLHKDLNNKIIYQSSEQLPGTVSKEPLLCDKGWSIKKENIVIAGHNCRKATAVDDTDNAVITAWYALDISVSDGPSTYCGLPGMILRVETESYTIQAIQVETNGKNQKNKVIMMPKADQYVTDEEFKKAVKKRH